MIIGFNWDAHFSTTMRYENGWSLVIVGLPCGHVSLTVIPDWCNEHHEVAVKMFRENPEFWHVDIMEKRGDHVKHFKSNDDELLDYMVGVSSRPMEDNLKKVSQDIMKAVKS